MLKNTTLLFLSLVLLSFFTVANDKTSVLPEYKFVAKENVLEIIEQKQEQAKQSKKLLMVVMGAEWCHYSRGLAKNFSKPQLHKELIQKYEIEFVDVGFLNKGFDVTERYQQPIYYATPSIMIIEPNSEEVLNLPTLMHWSSADAYPIAEYQDYFINSTFKPTETKLTKNSTFKNYYNQIKAFETQQASRLKQAYGIIGPLLKAYKKSGDKKPSKEFIVKWDEAKEFRTAVPNDINNLLKQAHNNALIGVNPPLLFPSYKEFSWESE